MKKTITTLNPEWPLRIGLGFVFIYSGFHIVTDPSTWAGFLPLWMSSFISQVMAVESYMRIQGAGELILGTMLLLWFLPRIVVRIASLLVAFEVAFILVFVGVDAVTFRDLGLLGAACALYITMS